MAKAPSCTFLPYSFTSCKCKTTNQTGKKKKKKKEPEPYRVPPSSLLPQFGHHTPVAQPFSSVASYLLKPSASQQHRHSSLLTANMSHLHQGQKSAPKLQIIPGQVRLDCLPGDRLEVRSWDASEPPGNIHNCLKKSPKLLIKPQQQRLFLDKENTCRLIRAAETQSVGLCARLFLDEMAHPALWTEGTVPSQIKPTAGAPSRCSAGCLPPWRFLKQWCDYKCHLLHCLWTSARINRGCVTRSWIKLLSLSASPHPHFSGACSSSSVTRLSDAQTSHGSAKLLIPFPRKRGRKGAGLFRER